MMQTTKSNQAQWPSLRQSWGDPVRGGWWKALLLTLAYWILRSVLESRLYLNYWATQDFPALDNVYQLVVEAIGQQSGLYLVINLVLLLFLLAGARLFKMKLFDFDSLDKQGLFFVVKAYLLMWLASIGLNVLIAWLAPDYVTPDNQAMIVEMTRYGNPLYLALTMAVVVPITEEILFRGLLMKYLSPLLPSLGALVSFVTFVMAHGAASWVDWLIYGTLALALVYTYWRTRRLEYAILLHMIQNTIATLAIFYG